jgi:Tol biopolymer transport system component
VGNTVKVIESQDQGKVWSQDGKSYCSIKGGWLLVDNGETLLKIEQVSFVIGWSSDSQRIVYCVNETGSAKIFQASIYNKQKSYIAGSGWGLRKATIHLKNDRFAFRRIDGIVGGGFETFICIHDLFTNHAHTLEKTKAILTQESQIESVQWSPDLSKIAFARGGSIWIVSSNDSQLQRLTEGYAPQWSSDGKHIAFLRSPQEKIYELWVMRVEEV